MSTAFFWDEKQKKFICERRAWNGDFKGRGQYLFVFNSVQDFIELMNAERTRLVYDEYGLIWTVDLLRYDILNKGFVVFCFEYWSNEE